jgi:hypothetical protein
LEVDQQTIEEFRAMAAYVAESLLRDEHALGDLPDEERKEVSARLQWRRRELQAVLDQLDQLEEDLFARDVLRDLRDL